jgi:hypothetical protein
MRVVVVVVDATGVGILDFLASKHLYSQNRCTEHSISQEVTVADSLFVNETMKSETSFRHKASIGVATVE